MMSLFMSIAHMISSFKQAVSCFSHCEIIGFGRGFVLRLVTRAVFGVFICIIALGSVVVAAFVGAARGHSTDSGVLQGGILGAMVGAITAVQLLKSVVDEQPLLSKHVALLSIDVDGKTIMEVVSPAILKAYQWQMMTIETRYEEIWYSYDTNEGTKALSRNSIQRLPVFINYYNHQNQIESDCPICLQAWENGELGRKVKYRHTFHMNCIDEWLTRQGTCPICR